MYLLPSHHSIAENLLSAISAQSAKSRWESLLRLPICLKIASLYIY
jgi:hypothetical protein